MRSAEHLVHEKCVEQTMSPDILPVGSLVYVTSYSPFRGLRGTVQAVNTIADGSEVPFCFYQVAVQGAYINEPIWFEYHEVEAVTPYSVAPLVRL